jgi:glyoxylase-like metal-dependent hydrolase (beta-lactamase superfamily II)
MYAIIIPAALILLFASLRFRPSLTKKITEGLYAVGSGFVNFYACVSESGVLVFDAGLGARIAERGLKKLGIPPEDVTHVFLTHTDYDHAGGAPAFKNAVFYISKEEEQMINGKTPRRGFLYNSFKRPYRTLEDGETVTFGNTAVQARLAPGHTPGSAAYLIDGRFLATGDLLRVTKKGSILPFARLMNKSHRQNIQSVEEAKSLINGAEYILTGHTGFYKMRR